MLFSTARERAATLAAAIVLVAVPFVAPAASAQDDVAAARACTPILSDAARLACYDRALGGGGDASGSDASGSDEAGGAGREAAADRAPSSSAVDRVQSPRADDEPEVALVTVVEVRATSVPNTAVFVTADGMAFVQIDSRRAFLPDVPFPAEIRPGAFGSYFLEPAERGRPIRVRRQ